MHTKGPWKQGVDHFGKPSNRIEDTNGNVVAFADWHPEGISDWKLTEANARLIAAAPELLEATRKSFDILGNIPEDLSNWNETNSAIQEAHDILEEAIRNT